MLPVREQKPRGTKPPTEDIQFEIAFFEGIVRRDPRHIEALQILGDAYTKTGQWARSLKVDERLAKLCPTNPVVFFNLACSYALLGRIEAALAALANAVRLGYADADWLAQDPDLDNLRSDPRFQAICRRIPPPRP